MTEDLQSILARHNLKGINVANFSQPRGPSQQWGYSAQHQQPQHQQSQGYTIQQQQQQQQTQPYQAQQYQTQHYAQQQQQQQHSSYRQYGQQNYIQQAQHAQYGHYGQQQQQQKPSFAWPAAPQPRYTIDPRHYSYNIWGKAPVYSLTGEDEEEEEEEGEGERSGSEGEIEVGEEEEGKEGEEGTEDGVVVVAESEGKSGGDEVVVIPEGEDKSGGDEVLVVGDASGDEITREVVIEVPQTDEGVIEQKAGLVGPPETIVVADVPADVLPSEPAEEPAKDEAMPVPPPPPSLPAQLTNEIAELEPGQEKIVAEPTRNGIPEDAPPVSTTQEISQDKVDVSAPADKSDATPEVAAQTSSEASLDDVAAHEPVAGQSEEPAIENRTISALDDTTSFEVPPEVVNEQSADPVVTEIPGEAADIVQDAESPLPTTEAEIVVVQEDAQDVEVDAPQDSAAESVEASLEQTSLDEPPAVIVESSAPDHAVAPEAPILVIVDETPAETTEEPIVVVPEVTSENSAPVSEVVEVVSAPLGEVEDAVVVVDVRGPDVQENDDVVVIDVPPSDLGDQAVIVPVPPAPPAPPSPPAAPASIAPSADLIPPLPPPAPPADVATLAPAADPMPSPPLSSPSAKPKQKNHVTLIIPLKEPKERAKKKPSKHHSSKGTREPSKAQVPKLVEIPIKQGWIRSSPKGDKSEGKRDRKGKAAGKEKEVKGKEGKGGKSAEGKGVQENMAMPPPPPVEMLGVGADEGADVIIVGEDHVVEIPPCAPSPPPPPPPPSPPSASLASAEVVPDVDPDDVVAIENDAVQVVEAPPDDVAAGLQPADPPVEDVSINQTAAANGGFDEQVAEPPEASEAAEAVEAVSPVAEDANLAMTSEGPGPAVTSEERRDADPARKSGEVGAEGEESISGEAEVADTPAPTAKAETVEPAESDAVTGTIDAQEIEQEAAAPEPIVESVSIDQAAVEHNPQPQPESSLEPATDEDVTLESEADGVAPDPTSEGTLDAGVAPVKGSASEAAGAEEVPQPESKPAVATIEGENIASKSGGDEAAPPSISNTILDAEVDPGEVTDSEVVAVGLETAGTYQSVEIATPAEGETKVVSEKALEVLEKKVQNVSDGITISDTAGEETEHEVAVPVKSVENAASSLEENGHPSAIDEPVVIIADTAKETREATSEPEIPGRVIGEPEAAADDVDRPSQEKTLEDNATEEEVSIERAKAEGSVETGAVDGMAESAAEEDVACNTLTEGAPGENTELEFIETEGAAGAETAIDNPLMTAAPAEEKRVEDTPAENMPVNDANADTITYATVDTISTKDVPTGVTTTEPTPSDDKGTTRPHESLPESASQLSAPTLLQLAQLILPKAALLKETGDVTPSAETSDEAADDTIESTVATVRDNDDHGNKQKSENVVVLPETTESTGSNDCSEVAHAPDEVIESSKTTENGTLSESGDTIVAVDDDNDKENEAIENVEPDTTSTSESNDNVDTTNASDEAIADPEPAGDDKSPASDGVVVAVDENNKETEIIEIVEPTTTAQDSQATSETDETSDITFAIEAGTYATEDIKGISADDINKPMQEGGVALAGEEGEIVEAAGENLSDEVVKGDEMSEPVVVELETPLVAAEREDVMPVAEDVAKDSAGVDGPILEFVAHAETPMFEERIDTPEVPRPDEIPTVEPSIMPEARIQDAQGEESAEPPRDTEMEQGPSPEEIVEAVVCESDQSHTETLTEDKEDQSPDPRDGGEDGDETTCDQPGKITVEVLQTEEAPESVSVLPAEPLSESSIDEKGPALQQVDPVSDDSIDANALTEDNTHPDADEPDIAAETIQANSSRIEGHAMVDKPAVAEEDLAPAAVLDHVEDEISDPVVVVVEDDSPAVEMIKGSTEVVEVFQVEEAIATPPEMAESKIVEPEAPEAKSAEPEIIAPEPLDPDPTPVSEGVVEEPTAPPPSHPSVPPSPPSSRSNPTSKHRHKSSHHQSSTKINSKHAESKPPSSSRTHRSTSSTSTRPYPKTPKQARESASIDALKRHTASLAAREKELRRREERHRRRAELEERERKLKEREEILKMREVERLAREEEERAIRREKREMRRREEEEERLRREDEMRIREERRRMEAREEREKRERRKLERQRYEEKQRSREDAGSGSHHRHRHSHRPHPPDDPHPSSSSHRHRSKRNRHDTREDDPFVASESRETEYPRTRKQYQRSGKDYSSKGKERHVDEQDERPRLRRSGIEEERKYRTENERGPGSRDEDRRYKRRDEGRTYQQKEVGRGHKQKDERSRGLFGSLRRAFGGT